MEFLNTLKKEHEKIAKEIGKFEEMIDGRFMYTKLFNTFVNLQELWNDHEIKEARIFSNVYTINIPLPEKMPFEHKILKGHKKVISDAIVSGNENEIKVALDTDGRMLIDKLKEHIQEEERLLNKLQQNEEFILTLPQ
jgi:hypothetical protein